MTWLILEDNPNRAAAFERAAKLAPQPEEIRIWRIAAQMIEQLPTALPNATLVSLDHDLYKQNASDPDPGCGRDVANYLARQTPYCPVIVHSTNTDAAWGMHNELKSAGWQVDLIHHLDETDWIETRWLALARKMARVAPRIEDGTNASLIGARLPDPIDFESLPWQSPLPGARFKAYHEGGKQIRLVEFTSSFVEPTWCEKGHAGYVLEGMLEVDFNGHVVTYPQGAGIFIPEGAGTAHKARALTPMVRLILVEDAPIPR